MEKKYADCEPLNSTRDLVKFLNNNNIQREDVLAVLDIKGQLLLIYYH